MNPLLFAAHSFLNLLDTEYILILGKKKNLIQINIRFEKNRFHHLGGFHRLDDIPEVKNHERESFFDRIIAEEIGYEDLKKSNSYNIVEKRLVCVSQLADLLNDNRFTFHYNFKKMPGSRIKADYLIKGELEGKTVYFFVSKNDLTSSYSGISIFYEDGFRYEQGQTRYTTLQIIKKDLLTSTENIVYSSPSLKK